MPGRLRFRSVTRLCERPGCSDPAEVAYGFDAEARTVWLDAFAAAQGARSGVLCRRHADAMVVPRGWSLDDRREPLPRLFRPDAPTAAPTAPSTPRRRQVRRDDTEQLRLGDMGDEIPDDEVEAAADDNDTATAADAIDDVVGSESDGGELAAPWVPQFDQGDDLAGLLKARGPLLSRAFGGQARPAG